MGDIPHPPEPVDLSGLIDRDGLEGSMRRHPAGKGLPADSVLIRNARNVLATWSTTGLTVSFTTDLGRQCVRFDTTGQQALRDALGGAR